MYPICPQTERRSAVPNIEMFPLVGGVNPARARSKVVFPAPLSPRMA